MNKKFILGICITTFVVFAAWSPNVLAYESYNNAVCEDCHSFTDFSSFTSNHSYHVNTLYISPCTKCHQGTDPYNYIYEQVATSKCANCHGDGIVSHHIDSYGGGCEACHDIQSISIDETNCSDGVDNNSNGLTDCKDSDCAGFVGRQTSCGVGACAATGNLVCQNSGQVNTCQPGTPRAEGPYGKASCTDGIDNDCDTLIDTNDPDCKAPPETCNDGIDNNGNGLVDCKDPQCNGFVIGATSCGVGACAATGNLVCQNSGQVNTCQPGSPSAEGPYGKPSCTDNIDNDCDNLIDTSDSDCTAQPEICDNNNDDNNNGLVDCKDPQCNGETFGGCDTGKPGVCADGTLTCDGSKSTPVCIQDQSPGIEGPSGNASCGDGIDNNCNNLTDGADPNCQSGPEICDNNRDDNGDGLVDCADPLCESYVGQPGSCATGLPGICSAGTVSCNLGEKFCDQDTQAVTEGPYTSQTCSDGLDNNCDGLVDCEDLLCNGTLTCDGSQPNTVVPVSSNSAGNGIFGDILGSSVIGYHLDGYTGKGVQVYMPVTQGFKALKGAQEYVRSIAPELAEFVRESCDSLEKRADAKKDGFLYRLGTHIFPVIGKIAEEGLELIGQEEYMNNAYSKTTISVAEFKQLEKQGLAIAPKRVKETENQSQELIFQEVLN